MFTYIASIANMYVYNNYGMTVHDKLCEYGMDYLRIHETQVVSYVYSYL